MKDALIHTSDEEDYDNGFGVNDEDDDDDSKDEDNPVCWTEICHNILIQGDKNIEEILHPSNINEGHLVAYLHHQNRLYSQIYGSPAIDSKNINEFKALLKQAPAKTLKVLKCYLFGKSCNLSRSNGDELLKLIRFIAPENVRTNLEIPLSWKTINRTINEQTKFYNCHKVTIPFPAFWEMDKWVSNNGTRPEEVVIRVRDLLQLVSEQLVNPIIQMLWKEHVKLNVYKKNNAEGENVTCNIMTSEWAHLSQKEIIEKFNPEGLLLPVCFYLDGVSPGMNGKTSITPVMFTLGYYIGELRRQDISKNVIGFICKMAKSSDESLIKHLKEVKRFSRKKAEENIKYFKKQVYFKFWEIVLDSLKVAASKGMLVKILGHEEPKLLFPRIVFNAGDDPAQHEIASIKYGGKVKHSCIRCMFHSRDGGLYDPTVDTLRSISIKDKVNECAIIYQKQLRKEKTTIVEKALLKDLQDKGYNPINNPFFNAPFGVNNHIYNTPTDLMHLFSCGLIKSILQWTLVIIGEISHHQALDNSSPYANNKGTFDRRLQDFPDVPLVPHLNWCKFNDGLMYISSNKSVLEKSYATGSGGGFRSSEYVVALMQTYFAVSYIHI